MKNSSPAARRAKPTVARTRRIVFCVNAEPGSEVAVSGDFNNWAPEGRKMADKKGDGRFTVTMNLAPGIYEYKFLIDKTWCVDPNCKDWIPNAFGTLNSVLHVE
jgi:1,4-alpha-glucan branching enzyme